MVSVEEIEHTQQLMMEREFYEEARRIYESKSGNSGNIQIAKRLPNGREYVMEVSIYPPPNSRINCNVTMYDTNGQSYKTFVGPMYEFLIASYRSLASNGINVPGFKPRYEDHKFRDGDPLDLVSDAPEITPEGYGEW